MDDTASPSPQEVVGVSDDEIITGNEKYVKGDRNTISGYHCIVIGNENSVSGSNEVRGDGNVVDGPMCKVAGDCNRVCGEEPIVTGDCNTVIGNDAYVRGDNNSVRGDGCEVWGIGNQVIGYENTLNGNPTFDYPGSDDPGYRDEEDDDEEEATPTERAVKRQKTIRVPSEDHEDRTTSNKACVVCLVNEPLCAALPCGHFSFCVTCSRSLVSGEPKRDQASLDVVCPVCRGKVDEFKYMHTC